MSHHVRGFAFAGLLTAAFVFACAKDPPKSKDWRSEDGSPITARISAQLTGNDFTGNSVLISGARDPAADGKLPCSSSVSICLNFNADGTTPVLVDLCATDMAGPTGLWSFAYTVFDGVDCVGSPVGNLVCPSTGPEALPPGVVTTNNVICTAATAAKTWDFSVDASAVDCPVGQTCIPVGESFKRVFVTSTTYDGNLGGPLGADALCAARATAAGLTGTYMAWISNTETEPGGRFTQSSDPYRLLTGTLIALNWADLTDGTLANPIDRTELGGLLTPANAWTSTATNGTYFGPNDCLGYTSASASASGLTGRNFTTGTGTEWTQATTATCDTQQHLYCFEQ